MESDLRPRLCYLSKGDRGYGFHLHGERNKGGQFIRKVEPGSSAELAGLRPGDRVVEVNGENVEKETHLEVVSRICGASLRTRLLVVDRDTDSYLRSRGLACTEDLAIEMGNLCPLLPRAPTSSSFLIPRENSSLSLKQNHIQSLQLTAADSSTAADTELQMEVLPRLCHLVKGINGYGFNLHNDKTKGGQFVQSVEPGSAAESADVRPGDRLIEVNGVNIEGRRHSAVVTQIRAGGNKVQLLVVDHETDELLQRQGITLTTNNAKEDFEEESASESMSSKHFPNTELPTGKPSTINVTVTDSPDAVRSPEYQDNGSSASLSSRSSTTQSDSSSDFSIQAPDEYDRRVSNPSVDSGLRLSPTAAQAKQKALACHSRKRAPHMDWSKKQKIFSNF
ncbi:Na(+)/H(+) exchange regulatory cofactor NHE-RF2 [Mastacembelus armatus]|uniref:Na(+)/H(+) exchange regulatory cofactor NHE-RF2-like n=1 Tax=Mastacembelus armatus TaxID=205130 RepID=A0A3Q3LWS6_9TELE|nr:Na(+)/H(+) exchange regulatory cofactor NHE-RF2-like [Mastacembelus armatus]